MADPNLPQPDLNESMPGGPVPFNTLSFRVVPGLQDFSLQLVLHDVQTADERPEGVVVATVLAEGFLDPQDAVAALQQALTQPQPDLEVYDTAIAQVSQLMDYANEAEARAQQLSEQVEQLQAAIQDLQARLPQQEVPAPGRRTQSPFPQRQAAAPAGPFIQAPRTIPSLRQSARGAESGTSTVTPPRQAPPAPPPPPRSVTLTKDKPETQQDLSARVHGQPFGGPSRGRWSGGGNSGGEG